MKLHLGFGPGPRLLAPGVPDWVGADGVRVGWVIRDRLFLRTGDDVDVIALPDLVEDVVATPEGWVCGLGNGFVRVNPVTAQLDLVLVDDEADPVTTRAGRDAVLFVEVPAQRLLRLADGVALDLPDAALRARHLRPWASGLGACWVDHDTLYRMGSRVSALGRATEPEAIATGPDGAVAVATKTDTVVAAPLGVTMKVGRSLDLSDARFSPDGRSMLAADEDGVVLVDLTTGVVLRTWEGPLTPVGWAPEVLMWDTTRGAIVDGDGAIWLEGLAGGVGAAGGSWLVGPGGALWDHARGARIRDGLRDEVYATDGQRVLAGDDTSFGTLDGPRFPHGLVAGDDTLAGARLDGDACQLVTADGETGRYTLADGTRTKRGHVRRPVARTLPDGMRVDRDAGSVTVDRVTYPLPVDGAVRTETGVWLWNDEGMLVSLG